MSVSSSIGKLSQAAKDLRAQWRDVRQFWHDENSRRFDERYLAPLHARLRQVELAMGQMATILHEVRHDCE